MEHRITIKVNGETYEGRVKPQKTLVDFLRDDLGFTGVKKGCDLGDCGACTVLMDGRPINSCLVLAVSANGKEIVTIEGLAQGDRLDPVQESFVRHGAIQCGFCTPGIVLTAKALLASNPNPSEQEIREALIGNICRCTGYQKIIEAIKSLRKEEGPWPGKKNIK